MTQVSTIDTAHEELIHDAQLDYYGVRLATCSSDRSIKIFDVSNNQQRPLADLRRHEGPVWQLSWSHPTFGSLLASCSYDKKVFIWKEVPSTGIHGAGGAGGVQYTVIYEYTSHTSSVNTVAWAPYEYGLMLACGSSDGSISVLTAVGDQWSAKKIPECHPPGVNALSWAPAVLPPQSVVLAAGGGHEEAATSAKEPLKRFASGGCDNVIRIWKEQDDTWVEEAHLDNHTDWVRDVAWAPTFGFHKEKLASCSQDGCVYVWTRDARTTGNNWEPMQIGSHFPDVVWSVSWSLTGDILAVASADKVSLWKEALDGKYTCLTTPSATTATGASSSSSANSSTTAAGPLATDTSLPQDTSSFQQQAPLMVS